MIKHPEVTQPHESWNHRDFCKRDGILYPRAVWWKKLIYSRFTPAHSKRHHSGYLQSSVHLLLMSEILDFNSPTLIPGGLTIPLTLGKGSKHAWSPIWSWSIPNLAYSWSESVGILITLSPDHWILALDRAIIWKRNHSLHCKHNLQSPFVTDGHEPRFSLQTLTYTGKYDTTDPLNPS